MTWTSFYISITILFICT